MFLGSIQKYNDRFILLLSFTEKKVNKESRPKSQPAGFVCRTSQRCYANKPAGSHLFGFCPRAAKVLISN
jgi:hypothetical protein